MCTRPRFRQLLLQLTRSMALRNSLAFFARSAAILGLVAATTIPASAQDADAFVWSLDPITLEARDSDVDTNSAKWQEYRDLGDGFQIDRLRLFGHAADWSRTVTFDAENVRRDDARYTLTYRAPARYRLIVDYNKIVHRFGNGGRLIHTRTGPGVFEVSDATQAALQAAITAQHAANRAGVNFAFLNGLLAPYLAAAQSVDLGLQRDRTHVAIELGRLQKLGVSLKVDHENRTGSRAYGGTFGFSNVVELPEPIDFDTSAGEIAGAWAGKKGGVRFGLRMEEFENNIDFMIWDNPFRITDTTDPSAYQAPGSASINGPARALSALSPDSEAATFFADGRARFGSWWTSAAFSYSRHEQDADLAPYTLSSAVVGVNFNGSTFDATNRNNLPQLTADREAAVMAMTAAAGTRFATHGNVDVRLRYYDYDNKSDDILFPGYVRFQSVWEDIGRTTVPYAYSLFETTVEVGWDLGKTTHLGLELARKSTDREFRETTEADDDTVELFADTRLGPVDVRFSYTFGDRSTDHYEPDAEHASFLDPGALTNNPNLRRFDQAERDTTAWSFLGSWIISEQLDLTFGTSGTEEDYTKSTLGLQNDELVTYHAELGWTATDTTHLYVFGHRGDRELFQRGRQSAATPSSNVADNYELTFSEVNDTFGIGFDVAFGARWTAHAEGRVSNADGDADFFSPPGGTPDAAIGFTDYDDSDLYSSEITIEYAIEKNSKVGLHYLYEDYDYASHLTRGLRNYLPGELLLNPDIGGYQGHVLGLTFTLGF